MGPGKNFPPFSLSINQSMIIRCRRASSFLPILTADTSLYLVHEKSFFDFVLDDGGVAELVKPEFFEEDVVWNFDWSAQTTAALVVVKDRLEGRSMAV